MQKTTILDLGTYGPPRRKARAVPREGALYKVVLIVVVGLAALVVAPSCVNMARGIIDAVLVEHRARPVVRFSFESPHNVARMTVDDKTQILAEGITAQQRNALISVSQQPVEQARRFLLASSGNGAYGNALKCLTQAVYYEAGFEPLEGRRAVAQVVLNRVRHHAYPKSVCGVVYQGAEKPTGCQFSFTCDGALLRHPAAAAWRGAEDVARQALGGRVETTVGTATHYHADYVLPKWAFEMDKITQLGRHIFYRFAGNWGTSGALSGHYSGVEQIPAVNLHALRERGVAVEAGIRTNGLVEGLTVPPEITDRHAPNDVGGRLDMTKAWRLSIPDPVNASTRFNQAVATMSGTDKTSSQHLDTVQALDKATSL